MIVFVPLLIPAYRFYHYTIGRKYEQYQFGIGSEEEDDLFQSMDVKIYFKPINP